MDLTEDDVLEILKLIEQSEFDYFQLEQGELKLTVAKNGYVPSSAGATAVAAAPAPAAIAPPPAAPAAAAPASAPAQPAAAAPGTPAEGLVPVTAPMVGTFYAAPSPEDPPYITKGARVAAGATLGLIEVMKVFTSVKADVGGVVEEILINNAQFVEYGQTLFHIRPD